jgi:hypothetical protein
MNASIFVMLLTLCRSSKRTAPLNNEHNKKGAKVTKFDGLDVFEVLHEDSTPLPGEGVEPPSSGKILPEEPQSALERPPRNWGATFELNHLFFVQQWHKPYAEALLEEDFTKLPELITAAERAILTRYLELNASKIPTDERLDLRHAVDALVQLKTRVPPPPVS